VQRFDYLEEAVARAGAHKVLFGSDGPWLHPGLELAKVHALHLEPRDAALVLGGNWLRLTSKARRSIGTRGGVGGRGSVDREAEPLPLRRAPQLQCAVRDAEPASGAL